MHAGKLAGKYCVSKVWHILQPKLHKKISIFARFSYNEDKSIVLIEQTVKKSVIVRLIRESF